MAHPMSSALKMQLESALERGLLSDAEIFCQELIAALAPNLTAHKEIVTEAFFRMSSILELQGRDGTSFRMLGQVLEDFTGSLV